MTQRQIKNTKMVLYAICAYLFFSSAFKILAGAYVYWADTPAAIAIRNNINPSLASLGAASIWLDFSTYAAAVIGSILVFLNSRMSTWFLAIALVGKVVTNLYVSYLTSGLAAIGPKWMVKALVAWGIFFLAAYLSWLLSKNNGWAFDKK